MANWALCPLYSLIVDCDDVHCEIKHDTFVSVLFWYNCYQYTLPEQLTATIKGQIIVRTSWICSPS